MNSKNCCAHHFTDSSHAEQPLFHMIPPVAFHFLLYISGFVKEIPVGILEAAAATLLVVLLEPLNNLWL